MRQIPATAGTAFITKTAAGLAGAADASVTEDAEPKASVLQVTLVALAAMTTCFSEKKLTLGISNGGDLMRI